MRIEDCATSLLTASKTPGADCGARLRERDRLLRAAGPVAEHLRDRRHRLGRRDVAVHREDGLVRMQVLRVPGDEIVARDGLHRRVRHLPRERRVAAVHQLAELAARDRRSGRRSGGRCRPRCRAWPPPAAPGRTAAAAGRRRTPAAPRRSPASARSCPAEPESSPMLGLDGGGATFEIAVERLGREATGAARSHLRAGQARRRQSCRPARAATRCGSARTRSRAAVRGPPSPAPRGRWAAPCASARAARRPAGPGTSTGPPWRPGRRRRQPRVPPRTNVARATPVRMRLIACLLRPVPRRSRAGPRCGWWP